MQQTDLEIQKAKESLFLFKKILDKHDVNFILDGGTLLGAHRDKDFCKGDHTDIDLTTLVDPSVALDILEDAGEKGFTLYHYWRGRKKATDQFSVKKDGIKIDLMFKSIKGRKAWWTIFKGKDELIYKAVPAKYYLQTKEIKFLGENFRIPKDTPGYLKYRYGNWKVPIHARDYSCYKSDKCIKESYEKI